MEKKNPPEKDRCSKTQGEGIFKHFGSSQKEAPPLQDLIPKQARAKETKEANSANPAHDVPDGRAISMGDAGRVDTPATAKFDREAGSVEVDDWAWLNTNDAMIREQRRFAGHDGLPRLNVSNATKQNKSTKGEQFTLFKQDSIELITDSPTRKKNESIASNVSEPQTKGYGTDKRKATGSATRTEIDDEEDAFIDPCPWTSWTTNAMKLNSASRRNSKRRTGSAVIVARRKMSNRFSRTQLTIRSRILLGMPVATIQPWGGMSLRSMPTISKKHLSVRNGCVKSGRTDEFRGNSGHSKRQPS